MVTSGFNETKDIFNSNFIVLVDMICILRSAIEKDSLQSDPWGAATYLQSGSVATLATRKGRDQ